MLEGRQGVFDRVVQQRRRHRRRIELHVGDDTGDLKRMGKIGIARGARLAAVRLQGKFIGPVQKVGVDRGVVAPDALHEFRLTIHRSIRPRPTRYAPDRRNLAACPWAAGDLGRSAGQAPPWRAGPAPGWYRAPAPSAISSSTGISSG